MKRSFSLMTLGLAVACLMTACKRTPSPPTEQDAIAVWNKYSREAYLEELDQPHKDQRSDAKRLTACKCTRCIYEAKEKSLVQLGKPTSRDNRRPIRVTIRSSWTEKGWMGPDQKIYPEH